MANIQLCATPILLRDAPGGCLSDMAIEQLVVANVVVHPTPVLLRWGPPVFPMVRVFVTVKLDRTMRSTMCSTMDSARSRWRVTLMPFTFMVPGILEAHIPMTTIRHMVRGVGGVDHMKNSLGWSPFPSWAAFLFMRAAPCLLLCFPHALPMLRFLIAIEPNEAGYATTFLMLTAPHLLWRPPNSLEVGQVKVTLKASACLLLVLAAPNLLPRIPVDFPFVKAFIAIIPVLHLLLPRAAFAMERATVLLFLLGPQAHWPIIAVKGPVRFSHRVRGDRVVRLVMPKDITTGSLDRTLGAKIAFTRH